MPTINALPYSCTFIKNALCMSLPPTIKVTSLAPRSQHAQLHLPWEQCTQTSTKGSSSQPARVRIWTLTCQAYVWDFVGGTPS